MRWSTEHDERDLADDFDVPCTVLSPSLSERPGSPRGSSSSRRPRSQSPSWAAVRMIEQGAIVTPKRVLGHRFLAAARIPGNRYVLSDSTVMTSTRVSTWGAARLTACMASCSSRTTLLACGMSALPAAVSCSRWPPRRRTRTGVPIARSRLAIVSDIVDCASLSAAAARLMVPCSTTASRARSWRISMSGKARMLESGYCRY